MHVHTAGLFLAVAAMASCGGSGSSGSTFTADVTDVMALQVFSVESKQDLTGHTVTATIDGKAVEIERFGQVEVVLACPDQPPGAATLVLSLDGDAQPAIQLTVEAVTGIATDPAAEIATLASLASADLDTLAAASPDTVTSAAITAARANLTALTTRYATLGDADRQTIARLLAANRELTTEATAREGAEFTFPSINAHAERFAFLAARIAFAGTVGALLSVPTAGLSGVAAGLLIARDLPDAISEAQALLVDTGIIDGAPEAGSASSVRADVAPLSFVSNQAAAVPLHARFRTLTSGDGFNTALSPDLQHAALAYGELSDAVTAIDMFAESPYAASPVLGAGTSADAAVDGEYVTISAVAPSTVQLVSSSTAAGLTATFASTGAPCASFTFAVSYDDMTGPPQQATIAATIDCGCFAGASQTFTFPTHTTSGSYVLTLPNGSEDQCPSICNEVPPVGVSNNGGMLSTNSDSNRVSASEVDAASCVFKYHKANPGQISSTLDFQLTTRPGGLDAMLVLVATCSGTDDDGGSCAGTCTCTYSN